MIKTEPFYAGFWSRALAFAVDIFMIGIPISIIIMLLFGYDAMQESDTLALLQGVKPQQEPNPLLALTQFGLSLIVYVSFWFKTGQTPGKKLALIKVVDAKRLDRPPLWRLVVRFVAYFVSFFTLVGFFLPLLLPKKQALHDLLSGTVVVYTVKP